MHQVSEICKSCGTSFSSHFCPNCGQRRFQRINRNYIVDEFKSIFIASNKGFFYTIKKLILNPGKTAREYLQGDRQKHYKPVLLALLLATISAFLSYQVMGLDENINQFNQEMYGDKVKDNPIVNSYMGIFKSYYSLIMVGLLPLYALASYLGFKKWGDNYYEHIVANAFFQSIYTVFSFLVFPVYFSFGFDNKIMMIYSSIFMLLVLPLYVWFMVGFYPQKSFGHILGRVTLTFFLIFLFFIFLFILLSIILGVYMEYFAPEMLEQFKTK